MQVKKNLGFTLIEVLIALVVLAIGLIGLAGLQATSLKNNMSSYNRSQAIQLAYDISDRMRANSPVVGNYLTSFMAPSSATVQATCMNTTGCTASAMATNDLYQWQQGLTSSLPSGQGSIQLTGSVYTVSVKWDDNRDGAVDANDPDFKLSFELL